MKTKRSFMMLSAIAGLAFVPSTSSHAATVLATLNSQDQIIGERMRFGPALGYHTGITTNLFTGSSADFDFGSNRNVVVGFMLPTLSLGQSIDSATFSISQIFNSGFAIPSGISLFGLSTTNPDGSGTSLFYESSANQLPTATLLDSAFTGSFGFGTPTADVTSFIQSLYTGLAPNQTEVFFRLNVSANLNPATQTSGVTFINNTAQLSFEIVPEPSAMVLTLLFSATLVTQRRRG